MLGGGEEMAQGVRYMSHMLGNLGVDIPHPLYKAGCEWSLGDSSSGGQTQEDSDSSQVQSV